jgi:hypothetical protein
MPPHRAGGKLTRSHTTLIDAAVPLVDLLQDRDEVTKISLGVIKNIGKGNPGLKFHEVVGGWKVVVRGNVSLQEFVVYTTNPWVTRRALERA